jgi:hypothetical protein
MNTESTQKQTIMKEVEEHFVECPNDNLYEALVKLSLKNLRERNNNAEDELRLQRMLEDHRLAAREENERTEEENKATLYGLMEKFLIENHELFVEQVELVKDEEDEDKIRWVIQDFMEGSAFVEFAVKNSDMMEEMIELILEDMFGDNDEFDADDLVDLYHELCNAPVLK